MVEWITTREMEQYLKVDRKTLWRWRAFGMPHYVVGGTIRFDRREVDDWIRDHRAAQNLDWHPENRISRGRFSRG
jgi:excisionase family DNA binding protein